ncbi:MAG: hypothetical protein EG823_09470 [Actinobacteria bacterium]|nr:hypothetical protein [Actinomycetota bacterium]
MSDRAIAVSCSVGLFVVATAIGLTGADKPPPLGLLWLVSGLVLVSVAVYMRLMANVRLLGTRRLARFGWIAVEGLVGGVALGVFLTLATGGGPEGSTHITDLALWFGVTGVVGAVFAVIVWAVALGLRAARRQG